ncbi:MAG: YdeI/OmpD-associated family protein [Methanobacteriaceae archaeon]|nr:YdeI/OmpD-associated family protein [Methanobacteriaceae archaeon]MDP3033658.1 YdeI/OmpD-associated family protein [Methanobacteriaceae archaeon]
MKSPSSQLGRYYPATRQEWRQWLKDKHETSPGIWIIYYKKGSQKPRVSYDDAVEEALSFGWIDSTAHALDEERYMQLFTPRKPNSTWSRLNKQRVEKLIKIGTMTPSGLEKIEIAKKNGSWSIMDDVENLIVPDDLEIEFKKNKEARTNYNNFSNSVKKQVLWLIISAKRPDTRKRRIKKVIKALEKNEKPFK